MSEQALRAYSSLEIRSIDDDERVIEGVASTPTTDRMEDQVDPEGIVYSLPTPFLRHHRSDEPVGHVIQLRKSPKAITVKVKFVRVNEPPSLKERLDVAWMEVKTKLVNGLSIGFLPLEWSDIKGTYGLRFTRWELLEISAVTVPANPEGVITSIKAFNEHARQGGALRLRPDLAPAGRRQLQLHTPQLNREEACAASGAKRQVVVRLGLHLPGVSGPSQSNEKVPK